MQCVMRLHSLELFGSVVNLNAFTILAGERMFGPKCWDVVAGEFTSDCQILDRLIKGLLDDGFAVKRSSGWHSLAKLYNYTHTARGFLY